MEEAFFTKVDVMTYFLNISQQLGSLNRFMKYVAMKGASEAKHGLKTMGMSSPGWVSSLSAAATNPKCQYSATPRRSSQPPGGWLVTLDLFHN